MTTPLRVLLVQDSDAAAEPALGELRAAGHAITCERIETADGMRAAMAASRFDLILSDWSLPGFDARAALAVRDESGTGIPFIVVSGSVGEEAAADAIRAGASDFVHRARLARLAPAVERELGARRARRTRAARPTVQRSDEDVVQSLKLEAIGRLAGGVAHDFSNLLSVILSYTDLVIAELDVCDPLRGDLIEVQRAGQQAAWLTGQLLAFSRRQILQTRVVDLNEVVVGMEKMIRRLIGEHVELIVNTRAGLLPIAIDPGQIEQVLMNLAANARDAMQGGGKLVIQTGNVELDERAAAELADATAGPHVVLAVTDTGCGMDAATREHIFEPFFTTKERGKGTGLGLSTVFGIVRQSGGTLSVASQPGAGTTFTIYFVPAEGPIDDAEAPLEALPPVELNGVETILLVEDDEPLRVLARGILRRYGYQVLEAQGAGDALLICEQHAATIDLLLTDMVMPRISGHQLADRLQPLRPEMRVLYMSGYTAEEMQLLGIPDLGALLLRKPITPELLGRRVRQALAGDSARTQPVGADSRGAR